MTEVSEKYRYEVRFMHGMSNSFYVLYYQFRYHNITNVIRAINMITSSNGNIFRVTRDISKRYTYSYSYS